MHGGLLVLVQAYVRVCECGGGCAYLGGALWVSFVSSHPLSFLRQGLSPKPAHQLVKADQPKSPRNPPGLLPPQHWDDNAKCIPPYPWGFLFCFLVCFVSVFLFFFFGPWW